jgi:hypothetical protein
VLGSGDGSLPETELTHQVVNLLKGVSRLPPQLHALVH